MGATYFGLFTCNEFAVIEAKDVCNILFAVDFLDYPFKAQFFSLHLVHPFLVVIFSDRPINIGRYFPNISIIIGTSSS